MGPHAYRKRARMTLALPFVTRWLLGRFGERTARWISELIGLALLGLALWFAYSWAWERGRAHEEAANAAEVLKIREERDAAMAELGRQDAEAAEGVEDTITRNREELDHETAPLPDRPLSDRQRARACRELVRQGRRCPAPAAGAADTGG